MALCHHLQGCRCLRGTLELNYLQQHLLVSVRCYRYFPHFFHIPYHCYPGTCLMFLMMQMGLLETPLLFQSHFLLLFLPLLYCWIVIQVQNEILECNPETVLFLFYQGNLSFLICLDNQGLNHFV